MQSFQLKINISNLKKEIAEDYFRYLDIFHKCLAGNLYLINMHNNGILRSTAFENAIYNQYFNNLVSSNTRVEAFLSSMNLPNASLIFLDTQLYLDQFISRRHNLNKLNIYNLTIDNNLEVIISLKRF